MYYRKVYICLKEKLYCCGKIMAKPIENTPVLQGEDVRLFYEELDKEGRTPNKKRLSLLRESMDIYKKVSCDRK